MMLSMTPCKNDKGEPKLANARTVTPSLYYLDICGFLGEMSMFNCLSDRLSAYYPEPHSKVQRAQEAPI